MRKKQRAGSVKDGRYREMVECIEDYAIFMLDKEGCILSWNAGAQRLKGYSPDEIIGEHFSIFYPDNEKEIVPPAELKEAAAHGRIEVEGWRLRKDRSRFWALIVITAMRDKEGNLTGYCKVTRNLTDRKEAEEKLRRSEEQFRLLVDGVEEYAIFMLDPAGHVATWNSGAEKIKQYDASEIIGKHFSLFYTPGDVAAGKPERNLIEARRLGHLREIADRVRKDGRVFQAEVVITALRDDRNNIYGFSKITRDLTDQIRTRAAEEGKLQAERASKAKDDFLAALSHELRTPLTPALAAAGFLADNAARLPSEFTDEVDTIRRNVQLEARLLDDLLDLTRITRGKLELRFQRVDAHQAVREALQIASPDSREKNLDVAIELNAAQHFIWADPVRIQQVFWNLINNAVKFTPPNGKISIRSFNDERGHFQLEVSDTGIGIESAQQSSLFQPFEQGERAVTRQFGGLGLGLAISKRLVDLHDGAISLKSRGRNRGTTFTVSLDAVAEQVGDSGVRARDPHKPIKSLRILLVEDHGDTRRTLSRLLSHFGHDISVADSTRTALEIVKAKEFDVVLSDIGLPDGSGYEVISQAKRNQRLKGVAITGFGTEEDVRRGKEAGFDFHLTKPVDFHELRSVLDQVST